MLSRNMYICNKLPGNHENDLEKSYDSDFIQRRDQGKEENDWKRRQGGACFIA